MRFACLLVVIRPPAAATLPVGNGAKKDDVEVTEPTLPFHKDERRIPNNAFLL